VPGRCEPRHRRDQLPGRRGRPARGRLHRRRRARGMGLRRKPDCPSSGSARAFTRPD
jgi:hypothetical protein